jgi:hypothetical protein
MTQVNYSEPVAKLLEIGLPEWAAPTDKWINYQKEYGLDQANIPELLQLATDEELYFQDLDDEGVPVNWGPVHAWRALGQLRAKQAIEPLLTTLEWDDDYSLEDLIRVFDLIGPAAIPSLSKAIQHNSADYSTIATVAVESLQKIAQNYPEALNEITGIMLDQLALFRTNDSALNGFLINSLTDLKAQEVLPLAEKAFEEDTVDDSMIRWHTVQYKFGLISQEEHDRTEKEFRAAFIARNNFPLPSGNSGFVNTKKSGKKQKEKGKAKRKIAKASRKKNRPRK